MDTKEYRKFEFDLKSYYENCKSKRTEVQGFIDCNIKEGYRTDAGCIAIGCLRKAGCPEHLILELTQKYCRETGADYKQFSSILFGSNSNSNNNNSNYYQSKEIKKNTEKILNQIPLKDTLEKTIIHFDNFILTFNEKDTIASKIVNAIRINNCFEFDYSDRENLYAIQKKLIRNQ